MSTRRSTVLSTIALLAILLIARTRAAAQAPATTPAATPPTAAADASPGNDDTSEVSAPPAEEAPPEGMVFDPTTGRYMPVGEQLPWRNSFFVFDNSVTHTTFDNSTLSETNYWVQTYGLRPRWNFNDTLSLRFRQDIYAELVASSVTSEHQPVVLDTQIDLVEAAIANVHGVLIGVGGRVLLPVSLLSRNANRVLGTGGQASATKVFADVLDGLVTQVAGSYQHWWATSSTPTGYAPESLCIVGNSQASCSNFATNTSVRDQFAASIFGQLQFTPELSAGASFTWLWWRGADLDPVDLGVVGAGVSGETLPDQSKTHWRNLVSSSLSASYQVNTWLQASLGLNTFTSQLNPNGNLRNPFWNPDTQYSLTAVMTVDQFYTTIIAPPETAPAPTAARRQQGRTAVW